MLSFQGNITLSACIHASAGYETINSYGKDARTVLLDGVGAKDDLIVDEEVAMAK